MTNQPRLRKTLSAPGLLSTVRAAFERIEDPVTGRGGASLADCLMSALAMFGMKYPSLLQFDHDARRDDTVRANLRNLYGVERAPSDTRMRERLDELNPRDLRDAYRRVFAALQRGKGLEGFTCLDGHYLLAVDGTGHHTSKKVHCDGCCEQHHRDGTTTYYHQLLAAMLVHPEAREVFALVPEAIMKPALDSDRGSDGSTKNDCERNAAKRLLRGVRREHPHLKLVVVADGLSSNAPSIRLLKELDMRFILSAKPGDHGFLFEWVASTPGTQHVAWQDKAGVRHRFRYLEGVPLNDANFDLEVTFVEYWETSPSGGAGRHFSWVTDLPVKRSNLMALMRAGRARWRIENETFNTLKNQGYGFEHNFGHGKKHLSTVLAYLMMLAFFMDQVQGRCCVVFRRARERVGASRWFWERVRGLFLHYVVSEWTLLWQVASGHRRVQLVYDTS